MKTRRLLAILPIGLLLADRLLKRFALDGTVLGAASDPLTFRLFKNGGIAFSLPLSGPLLWLLSIGILAAVSILAAKDFRVRHYDRAEAYALFIVGACSNLFDRVMYGFTVDYLIVASRSAVNLADGMILAGALWLLFSPGPATQARSRGRS